MAAPIPTRTAVADGLPHIDEQSFSTPGGTLNAGGMDGVAVAKLTLAYQGAVGLIAYNTDGSAVVVPLTVASGRVVAEVLARCCAEIESGNLDA